MAGEGFWALALRGCVTAGLPVPCHSVLIWEMWRRRQGSRVPGGRQDGDAAVHCRAGLTCLGARVQ